VSILINGCGVYIDMFQRLLPRFFLVHANSKWLSFPALYVLISEWSCAVPLCNSSKMFLKAHNILMRHKKLVISMHDMTTTSRITTPDSAPLDPALGDQTEC
jgi:hypothetical protein